MSTKIIVPFLSPDPKCGAGCNISLVTGLDARFHSIVASQNIAKGLMDD
jgi:hypothetical protein